MVSDKRLLAAESGLKVISNMLMETVSVIGVDGRKQFFDSDDFCCLDGQRIEDADAVEWAFTGEECFVDVHTRNVS